MTQPVPKPLFVIGDVHSSSYTTALDFTAKWSDSSKAEPILICGTNDGSINFWSLSTYRCIHHFEPTFTLRGLGLDEPSRICSIHFDCNSTSTRRLLVQLKSNVIYMFSVDNETFEYRLLHSWKSFQTTFAKCFPLFQNCFAFLSPVQSDSVLLVSTEQTLVFAKIKLCKENQLDTTTDHGVVMALHIFCKDVIPMEGITSTEKQGLFILVAYEDGFICLHRTSLCESIKNLMEDITTKSSSQTFEAFQMSILKTHQEMVTCVAFHEETMRGVACSVDSEIALFDVNIPETILSQQEDPNITQTKLQDLVQKNKLGLVERKSKRIRLTNASVLCCAIRPDGRIFATGGKDGRVRLFGLASGKSLAILAYHSNIIEAIRFTFNLASQETKKRFLLLAASRDKSISVWSLYNDE